MTQSPQAPVAEATNPQSWVGRFMIAPCESFYATVILQFRHED